MTEDVKQAAQAKRADDSAGFFAIYAGAIAAVAGLLMAFTEVFAGPAVLISGTVLACTGMLQRTISRTPRP